MYNVRIAHRLPLFNEWEIYDVSTGKSIRGYYGSERQARKYISFVEQGILPLVFD